MDEQDVLIRNKEAELTGLKLECLEYSSQLTDTLVTLKTTKGEIDALNKEKIEFEYFKNNEHSKIKNALKELSESKNRTLQVKKDSEDELKNIKTQIKESNKELARANGQVLSARDELKSVQSMYDVASVELSKLDHLIEIIPNLQIQVEELTQKKNATMMEIVELLNSSSLELTNAKQQLKQITQEVENKIKQASDAEYKCKKYTDELYTRMNDYEIIRTRLETVYNKKFPELDLNI